MPSPFTHPVAALAIATAFPRLPRWVIGLGVALTLAPDVDVPIMWAGMAYDSILGHRGLTHSIPFAALCAAASVLLLVRLGRVGPGPGRLRLFFFLFLAMASHGVLDGMTDGGNGIAYFSPFSDTRSFLPFRPVGASPLSRWWVIGWRGIPILVSEIVWIWLPAGAFALAALGVRRVLRRQAR